MTKKSRARGGWCSCWKLRVCGTGSLVKTEPLHGAARGVHTSTSRSPSAFGVSAGAAPCKGSSHL